MFGRDGPVPGRSIEPARLPARRVLVLVADPGQPVGDRPLVDARLARDAVEVVGRLLVGRQDGHAGDLHGGSGRDGRRRAAPTARPVGGTGQAAPAASRASRPARSAARPTVIDASSWSTRRRICWISSRSAAARSNSSCLAAAFISASIRATTRLDLGPVRLAELAAPLGGVDDGRLGDRAQPLVEVADALDDRRRLDAVLDVVGALGRPPAIGLVDRDAHRLGDRVGVHDHLAADVAGRPADHLDERPGRPQEALLVGVEDRDQGHLGQVDALAQEVDPDQDVEHPEAQVAQDRDPLERVDLAVEVLDLDPELLQVVGRSSAIFLVSVVTSARSPRSTRVADLLEQVVDLALGRADA